LIVLYCYRKSAFIQKFIRVCSKGKQ
jgi:hypothetical protein